MAGNLVSLERVHKAYGVRPLLAEVSLGVGEGDKVGVVGRNGDGKTTLLRVLAGLEPVDDGRVTRNRGLRLGYLTQGDDLDPAATVREAVLEGRAEHEWAADASTREVVEVLVAGLPLDGVGRVETQHRSPRNVRCARPPTVRYKHERRLVRKLWTDKEDEPFTGADSDSARGVNDACHAPHL